MIRYEVIAVGVTWTYGDLSVIMTYTNVGWRFVCYSPDGMFVYFDRKWKMKQE